MRYTAWILGAIFLFALGVSEPQPGPGGTTRRAAAKGDSEPPADTGATRSFGPSDQPAGSVRPAPVLESPEQYLDGMRSTQEKRVALYYVDLERELGLTREQADAVRALEVEHFMRVMNLHPVQILDDAAAERESLKELHDDIVALLGSGDASRFAVFEKSIDARKNVADIQLELAEARLPLSEEQRRALIQVSIRDQLYLPEEAHTGADSYDAYAQEMLSRVDQRNAGLLVSAQGVLDSRQLQKLQEIYEARRIERQRWAR